MKVRIDIIQCKDEPDDSFFVPYIIENLNAPPERRGGRHFHTCVIEIVETDIFKALMALDNLNPPDHPVECLLSRLFCKGFEEGINYAKTHK